MSSHIRRLPRDPTFDPAYISDRVVAIGNVKNTIGPRGVGACCDDCASGSCSSSGLGAGELIAGAGIIAPVALGLGLLYLALRSSRPGRARR